MYRKTKSKAGFTIIELMFAMAFVAVLLMAIASVVIQMSIIYNRGVTLREVNQSGRGVIDIMTRDIAEATPFKVSDYLISTADGGRLCLGTVTYAWSAMKDLDDSGTNSALTVYQDGEPVRFTRIEDPGAMYCRYGADGTLHSNPVSRDNSTELLNKGQRDLVLRQFNIEEIPNDPNYIGPKIYVVRATIGTNNSDFISVSGDNRCEPPDNDSTTRQQSYCSINEFKFAARAGNLE